MKRNEMMVLYTLKEFAADLSITEEEALDFIDISEGTKKIKCLYTVEEGGVTGLEFTDGTYGIVGSFQDSYVATKEEMVNIVVAYGSRG